MNKPKETKKDKFEKIYSQLLEKKMFREAVKQNKLKFIIIKENENNN